MADRTLERDDLQTYDVTQYDDSDLDDALLERMSVARRDAAALARTLDNKTTVAAGGTRSPRNPLHKAEVLDLAHRRKIREARHELRQRSGTLHGVDERGVRGDQRAPVPSLAFVEDLDEHGDLHKLQPFRREGGYNMRTGTMSTSWTDAVRIDAVIHTDTKPIQLPQIQPRRYVTPSNPPVAAAIGSALGAEGRALSLPAGREYALFHHTLKRGDAAIYSSPTLVINIDMVATFGRVSRDMSSSQEYRLEMDRVHTVLEGNVSLGSTVTLDDEDQPGNKGQPVDIFIEATQLENSPVATVSGRLFRHTFRYDPSPGVRRWRLVFCEWWAKRAQFQGIDEKDENVYVEAEVFVDGQIRDPSIVSAIVTEDATTNPLAPTLQIEIFPGRDSRTGRLMPLRRDQSIEVRIKASTRIIPPRRKKSTVNPVTGLPMGSTRKTRWALLPGVSFQQELDDDSVGFFVDSTNELMREAIPVFGGVRRIFRVRRRRIVDTDMAEELDAGGARGLTVEDVEWRVVQDYDEFGAPDDVLSIESMRVGPISQAAVRQAVLATAR